MGSRLLLCATVLLMSISLAAVPPKPGDPAPHPKSTASGKALFINHCASCHGEDAKGAGPAAIALKVQPPDLTALTKLNHGKFPYENIRKAINGETAVAAHGSREMPTWGVMFLAINGVNQHDAEQRITDLTGYLKSIQGK
ncbi:MAG: cytochrome c [Acidobacteriia bacterium]|nr:cytochrome c [Terriglobia bacterium]